MQGKLGAVIEPDFGGTTSGKSDPVSTSPISNGTANGNRVVEKGDDIIEGFDAYDPSDAVRIDSGTGNPRVTKSGRIDRRTRAGRNADTGATESSKKISPLVVDLSTVLLAIHGTAAALLSFPDLELDKEEADKLEVAIKKVAAFYPNSGLPPKVMAYIELGATCATIYGGRVRLLWRKWDKEAKERKATQGPTPVASPAPNPAPKNGAPMPGRPISPSEAFGYQGAEL